MKLKTQDLEALIEQHQKSAVGALNSSIGGKRSALMERYFTEPYGDEVDGRSTIVDSTVRDVIESIKPELMDIFLGGDKVVEFTPTGPEDVAAAEQETAVCENILMQQNDGFMILYSWFTDALLLKTGYIKRFWDERTRAEIEEYDDLMPDEAAALLAEIEATSDNVEILERAGGIDEETGTIEPMYLKLKRYSTEKRYAIENTPPEEIFVSPQWRKLNFDGCPFVAHRPRITRSDLIEMGFDKKQVEALQTYDIALSTKEAASRWAEDDIDQLNDDSDSQAMTEVEVWENYIRVDTDGDGVAELLQVFTAGEGGKILKRNGSLAIEEVTSTPFEVLCPLPIPHRHFGMSIAEIVEDLARINTVLKRQMLDNAVTMNNPDEVVDQDAMTQETIADLSQKGLARTIRIPGGAASYQAIQPVNTVAGSLQVLEYMEGVKEERTGITRFNQGLDPDSLNHTASGIKQLMSAAQKKILMIARIFAETGVSSLFRNMHRDLRAGPVRDLAVKLRNEYIAVNPRMWRHRADLTVNVGLGTGDRELQFQRLALVLAEQKEMLAQGLPIYPKMHTTYTRMLELSGFKDVANFFPTPEEVAQMQQEAAAQPKQPDPNMLLLQIEAQKNQMRAEADRLKLENDRMRMENDRLKVLMDDDRERDLAAAKIEADEAARRAMPVDGRGLTRGQ